MSERPQVVIVGGGFGGIRAAQALADADVNVILVDRTNHHLFQPLLYQVAAGILPEGLIAPAIRAVLSDQKNCRVMLGEVTDIDTDGKTIDVREPDSEHTTIAFDYLIVAAGATHSYFGRHDFAEYAPGMKTIEDARLLRDAILAKFEMAELSDDPVERAKWLTFVVIGAGPTGVELVGQIAELAHVVLPPDYRRIDTRTARIILLEGAPNVLPPFKPKLQKYTKKVLEEMGVEVRVNTLATGMTHDSITVKGPDGEETIPARTRVWAAGVQANPLAQMLADKTGLEVDRAGHVPVNNDCSVGDRDDIFAVGDMMSLDKLPGVAQVAMQQGTYVGGLIKARLKGEAAPPPFKYFDKGSMATIGYKHAVAEAFGIKTTGLPAFAMWGVVHIMFLIGWGNRLGALYTWARALIFSKNRGHRIITFEDASDDLTRVIMRPADFEV